MSCNNRQHPLSTLLQIRNSILYLWAVEKLYFIMGKPQTTYTKHTHTTISTTCTFSHRFSFRTCLLLLAGQGKCDVLPEPNARPTIKSHIASQATHKAKNCSRSLQIFTLKRTNSVWLKRGLVTVLGNQRMKN